MVGVNESFISLSVVRLAGVALLSKRAQGGTGKLIEGVKRGVLGPWDWARRCYFWPFVALSLAACSSTVGDTFDVGPFMREQITGDSWRACLAREYQTQARAQLRAGRHWPEATTLASKGRDALAGIDVQPEPANSRMPDVRARLDTALANRTQNPCGCATVQARYDGWSAAIDRKMDTAPFAKAFDDAVTACTAPR